MATIDIASSITRHRNDSEGVARSGAGWRRWNRIIVGIEPSLEPDSSGWRLPKDVSDPANRMDQSRLTIGLGFPAQIAHVDLQRIARGGKIETPHLLEDAAASEHPARIGDQHFQQ